jgi:hypothetical protein
MARTKMFPTAPECVIHYFYSYHPPPGAPKILATSDSLTSLFRVRQRSPAIQSCPSGPIPTFAFACSTLGSNVGIRTASNFMILVELLNLTFERELAAGRTQMSNPLH